MAVGSLSSFGRISPIPFVVSRFPRDGSFRFRLVRLVSKEDRRLGFPVCYRPWTSNWRGEAPGPHQTEKGETVDLSGPGTVLPGAHSIGPFVGVDFFDVSPFHRHTVPAGVRMEGHGSCEGNCSFFHPEAISRASNAAVRLEGWTLGQGLGGEGRRVTPWPVCHCSHSVRDRAP